MKIKIFCLLFLIVSFVYSIVPVGYLYLPKAVQVKFFTTMPGGKGKPKTVIGVVSGWTPVYQVFDWQKLDPRLKGNHKWYRVHPVFSHWIYLDTNYIFTGAYFGKNLLDPANSNSFPFLFYWNPK